MIINITVKPNSREQKITKDSEKGYIIFLKSPAHDNKANIELIKLLKKKWKKEVKIKKGLTSRKKVIELI